jgi:polyhydroxyalkanoate synthesis regulator phasin
MSDEKGKVADKASEIAKNIWLAGVGAYGKATGEAQERLEKAGVDTPKLFKDLVKAGAALEDEAREIANTQRSASASVEERINRVRENFSLNRLGRADDLTSLHAKIDLLSKKIDLLATALTEPAAKPRKKPPAKKASTAKPKTRAAAKKAVPSTRAKARKPKS